MRLLLVHQNFPGQFRDLAPALCDRGHELKAIGSSQRTCDPRIEVLRYDFSKPESSGIHHLTQEVDEWIRRGELVAETAIGLKQRGWAPDLMLAHPGWGEAMLLRQVFPASPLVIWPELWLKPEHMGLAGQVPSVQQLQYLRVKDWLVDGAMADAAAAVLPTRYQASTFPERWQQKIEVIHEGVTENLFDLPRLQSLQISAEQCLDPSAPVVTFISRNLEPMRGFPLFMKALPTLQTRRPDVQVVIVGGDELSYSNGPESGTWREVLLEELKRQLDLNRVHFLGRIPHSELIKIYRRSNLHVYLSEAFVLSWSLTELLACGTPVLAMSNTMLEELIQPGVNGALWRGDPQSLGVAMGQLLDAPKELERWGENSRQRMREDYHQERCVDLLEKLLQRLASRF